MAKVKLCGLRRPEDAHMANAAGPDYAGFIFAKGKRQVNVEAARELRGILHPAIKTVGVFVHEDIGRIAALCGEGAIDLVQLHGGEDDGYVARLREVCDRPIIRVVHVGATLPPLPRDADFLLFDTLSPALGGTGVAFDHRLLEGYEGIPYFLAGGLTPENVGAALARLAPYAVDVSSGTETDGVKDPCKMQAFVDTVKEMEACKSR